jgi:hypothetical protein
MIPEEARDLWEQRKEGEILVWIEEEESEEV